MNGIHEINELTTEFNKLKNDINAFIVKAKVKGIDISQNDFFVNKNKQFVYFINNQKVETDDFDSIPFDKISSPNEHIPGFQDNKTLHQTWTKENQVLHRLTGPAIFYSNGVNEFWLNGIYFETVNAWLDEHPNQDESFKKEMINRWG
jgi:hypothetical protein